MVALRTILLLALLVQLPTAALAGGCWVNNLFFWGQEFDCSIYTPVNVPVTIEVVLETWDLPNAIGEVCFVAPDWIGNPGPPLGVSIPDWSADEVIGDLETGITLRWSGGLPPVEAYGTMQRFLLGTIEVISFDASWPGVVRVYLEDVTYQDAQGHPFQTAPGEWDMPWTYCTFNDYGECWDVIVDPPDDWSWREIRYVLPPENDQVSGWIPLTFEVENWSCWYNTGRTYSGEVKLDGNPVHEFAGQGEGNHDLPIDISHVPNGTMVEVEIFVDYDGGGTDTVVRHYIVLTTPVESASFSALKSRY